MTLATFISSICKEIFEEENILSSHKKKNKICSNNTYNTYSKQLITEKVINTMIQNGTVNELTENSRFTPLARDIFQTYNQKNRNKKC